MQGIAISLTLYSCLAGQSIPHNLNSAQFVIILSFHKIPPVEHVLNHETIYQLDAIEYLFVFFQLDMFRAYTPIFRSNGCYSFFTYAAYGVL